MNHHKVIMSLIGVGIITSTFANTKTNDYKKTGKETQLTNLRYAPAQKEKEISFEISVVASNEIFLDNNNRNIEIKTWDFSKVKIVAFAPGPSVNTSDNSSSSLEQMNITTKTLGKTLTIKTSAFAGYNNSLNENLETSNIKKVITIYVPKDNKLSIESKYGDVSVTNHIGKLNADITNGNFDIDNANKLVLRSKYSNVNINKVQKGEIDFINGKLSIQNIDEAELDTKYANIEIENSNKLSIKSTNDNYELESIGILEGIKNYGTLRITNLLNTIQIDGTNADIKIKNLDANVRTVLIDNKYADLRLPLKKLKNFNFTYNGTYSTIYKYFKMESKTNVMDAYDSKITTSDIQNSTLKATVGNGKDADINLKCQNCTVDLR